MKKLLLAATFALPLAFSGCQQATQAVTTVCTDLAALPAPAVALLNAQDSHSALGVYWADAKSGCANGVPVAGVTTDWTAMMLGAVKSLAPIVLPMLIGLL